MKNVVIIGAGTMSSTMEDMVLSSSNYNLLGYLDDAEPYYKRTQGKYPILGPLSELPKLDIHAAVVAIGDNDIRARVLKDVWRQGVYTPPLIHPSAVICSSTEIGNASFVMPNAVVSPGCTIGVGCVIYTCASLDHDGIMENFSFLAPGAHTCGCVTLRERAFVGAGATIIPGRTIGKGSTVGAGAAVIRDIPENVIAVGVPARIMRRRP